MTILVTGGAGFIGSNFVSDWLGRCDEAVVNLDNLSYAADLRNLTALEGDPRHLFVRGDIGDPGLVAGLFDRFRPRAVVNFAAETHVDRSIAGPEHFIQTNIVSTFGLLERVRSYWDGLDAAARERFRFLQVSTDEVYGDLSADGPAFTESSRYRPNSPYSASKAAGDHLVRAWHRTYGLPVLTTNCSNNYGPFQYPEKLIPLIVSNAIAGRDLPVYGDGRQVRDWLHVTDHCAAVRAVLESGRVGEAYNIGGSAEHANIEVVEAICALLDELCPRSDGLGHRSAIRFVADRPGHDFRYAIDASKIRRETAWRPLETFGSGLRKTVLWYLQNPDRMVDAGVRTRPGRPDGDTAREAQRT